MKRAFMVVYEVANAELGLMLAREACKRRDFDLVMWSPYHLPNTPDMVTRAIEHGSVYIHENTATGGLADIWTPLSGWLSGKPTRLPAGLGQPACSSGWREALAALQIIWQDDAEAKTMSIRRQADAALRRVAFCEDILVRLGVDTLVFAEDNIERDSFAWIAAAHRRAIPVNVVTYGALSIDEAETAYKGSSAHQISTAEADILRRLLPHWLREGDGYAITRLPLMEALGREMAGLAVPNPWLVNTGQLDMIALESQSACAAYRAQNFENGRLIVTGHPFHDRLHAALAARDDKRAELAQRFSIDPDTPWLLVAMPPDQSGHRPVADGADFDALIHQFCQMSADITGWPVLVSPHPNLLGKDRDKLRAGPAHLIEEPIADYLPLADGFLASVSTTIKWALALGVPVIDFDCFEYAYPDFLDEPGVHTAKSKSDLTGWLQHLANPDRLAAWRAAAQARSIWWGQIDGQAMDRIITRLFNASIPTSDLEH